MIQLSLIQLITERVIKNPRSRSMEAEVPSYLSLHLDLREDLVIQGDDFENGIADVAR